MKIKRSAILALVLLIITAVVVFAAAQILTSSINITMIGAPPEPTPVPPTMTLLMLSDWSCTGADVANCSGNASGGVHANFTGVESSDDLRITRKIQNDSIKAVCITPSGLVSQGVVGSLLIASIPAYDSRDVAVAFDVSALGAGDEASLPTVNLAFDFCP